MIPGGLVTSLFIIWILYALSFCIPILGIAGFFYLYKKGKTKLGALGSLVCILFLAFNPVPKFLKKPTEKPAGNISINLEDSADFSWKSDIDFGRFFEGYNAFFSATGSIDVSIDLPGPESISEPARSVSVDYDSVQTKSVSFYFRDEFSDEAALGLLRSYNSRFGPIVGGESRISEIENWVVDGPASASMSDAVGFENIARFEAEKFQIKLSIRRPHTRSFDGPLKTVDHMRLRSIQIEVRLEQVSGGNG
jgi:hypothetical protein